MKQSISAKELEVVALSKFFQACGDGEELSWHVIETGSGVKMDMPGRQLARTALRRLKRPYLAVRGEGVKLSSASNTMTIMGGKFIRIDNAVRRADRSRKELSVRHIEQLPSVQKQKMLTLAGFFGAVRAFAKDTKAQVLTVEAEPVVKE